MGSFILGVLAGIGLAASFILLIVFDAFGAPHSRPKFWFEFWRSR